jgi:ribonuclease HII
MNSCKLFIGADEAGYGPNLGPLTIAATAWLAPHELTETALQERLKTRFCPRPLKKDPEHIPLGDSKQLYTTTGGLQSLEAGLLALLRNATAPNWSADWPLAGDFLTQLGCPLASDRAEDQAENAQHHRTAQAPWYARVMECELPKYNSLDQINTLTECCRSWLQEANVQVYSARATIISESDFNEAVGKLGSKGLLLSLRTLSLVAELLQEVRHEQAPIHCEVFCDRQGGRKNYLPILAEAFPDIWFQPTSMTNERCSYQNLEHAIDLHFSIKGDRFPPTGLASMIAKYLRERVMQQLNAFWAAEVPNIAPTAGYPQDAKRFRNQIQARANSLGLTEELWWRCK